VDEVTDPDSGAIVGYSYPDVENLAYSENYDDGSLWEVWLMYSADPGFQPKAGDDFLGGWQRENENREEIPPNSDLFEYVRPIGNILNETTSTFDGTEEFPIYFNGLGAPHRYWGSVNQAPDENQDRHVDCYRYVTNWSGQDYYRVRFVLREPFDKDNPPNALAILIYTDPERQNYFYTPGAFIWEPDGEYWYADTTIGQSPTSGPEPVYYCVALGSAPLNGGGTVLPFANEDRTDANIVTGNPEHISNNWAENLGLQDLHRDRPTEELIPHFRRRIGWREHTSFTIASLIVLNRVGWLYPLVFPQDTMIDGNYVLVKPPWMNFDVYNELIDAIEQARGEETINAAA
jgi:hypothetical protein